MDKITPVAKGQTGADILHEVLYKGQVCGRIVIDSKNRKAWQDGFITKLRADKIAAKADHAILSTTEDFLPLKCVVHLIREAGRR